MLKLTHLLSVLFLVTLAACSSDDYEFKTSLDLSLDEAIQNSVGDKSSLILPNERNLEDIPQDPKNKLTDIKVRLGKLLFHETGLGQDPSNENGRGTYSCASCHNASAGFQANRFQGIGDGGEGFGRGFDRTKKANYLAEELDVQPIRSPSILNVAYQQNMLWNGQFGATGVNLGTEANWTAGTPKEKNKLGFEGTEVQAIAGLDVHRLVITKKLMDSLGYTSFFNAAFPNLSVDERYTKITAGLAIAAYERTVLPNKAPFQKWLKGDVYAMSLKEKRGATVFFGKGGCYSCHNGPSLAEMDFHAIGMNDLFECPDPVFMATKDSPVNLGRADFTGNQKDLYKFKVPQLYNLKDSPFYGHGSSFKTIDAVIKYKNKGVKQNLSVSEEQLSPSFKPLNLTDQEVEDLTAFIEYSLYDADLKRYEPENLPSNSCFPSADEKSKRMLGCN